MAQNVPRRIEVEYFGDVTIATVLEKTVLDDRVVQELGRELESLVQPATKLLVRFPNTTYLSAAVQGKLITLRRRLDQLNGALRLSRICPNTMEVFHIAKLDDYFDLRTAENELEGWESPQPA